MKGFSRILILGIGLGVIAGITMIVVWAGNRLSNAKINEVRSIYGK